MNVLPSLKKILAVAVIGWIGYGGYAYFFKKKTANTAFTTVTATVKRGNIENSVEVIGVSALVYEQKMQFSQAGKVAKILFKEGDKVKKWQVMAELDTTDVLSDIKQQQVNLDNAQIKLEQTLKWPTEKDILNAENAVTSTKSKIAVLENDKVNILRDKANKQADYESQIIAKQSDIKSNENDIGSNANDIKSNENDIKNKQAQLANARNELITLEKTESKGLSDVDADITKTLDTALVDARKQIIDAEANLYNADEILGITDANRTKNDSYEVYLSAKDSTRRSQSERDWAQANTALSEAKSRIGTISSGDSAGVKSLLGIISKMEDAFILLWKDGTDMVNASIVSSSFPQSSIDSYANIFTAITSSSQASLTAVKNTLANVNKLTDPELQKASSNNTVNAKKQAIADMEQTINKLSTVTAQQYRNALAKLQNDRIKLQNDLLKIRKDMAYSSDTYDAQSASKDADIKNTRDTLKYNEESLRLLKAGATKEEIALAKNSIASQKLALEKVKENIKKYQLEAPFDGVVRKIDFQLGDNIVTNSSAVPAYLYIENPNLVEITASVDQLDVVKLKLGQDAKIVFDPFPTLTLTGKVSDINSTPAQTSGVTSYAVKITMDKGDRAIFSGMSAKVNIVIESKEDALFVGTSFVQKNRGQPSVLKRIGTVDTKTDVVLGISNPTNTEILSGVEEWDTLVRRISSGTGSATNSLIQLPGGGGNRWSGGGGTGGNEWGGGGNFNRGR